MQVPTFNEIATEMPTCPDECFYTVLQKATPVNLFVASET